MQSKFVAINGIRLNYGEGPPDDPANQHFRDRIDAAVQTMEQADGFIASDFDVSSVWGELAWQKTIDRPEFANQYVYTLSLWEDLESVFASAYYAAHGEALRHRTEWFRKGEWPVYVAWWVDTAISLPFGKRPSAKTISTSLALHQMPLTSNMHLTRMVIPSRLTGS